jgi:hypothetical protein
MSGVKSTNVSFINKFEKSFSTKFDFKIYLEDKEEFLHRLDEKVQYTLSLNLNTFFLKDEHSIFSFTKSSKSMSNITDVEYESL